MNTTDGQVVTMKIDGGALLISVDPNKDGQPILTLSIDLLEVPDEIVTALKKK